MFKLVAFVSLFALTVASSDISELFDIYLKDIVDKHQLVDGSFQTTYFNIPHREAPGLIEPFLFGTNATASQISVSNVIRLTPVVKQTRRQQVWDGEDYDYNVMATSVSMDIKVRSLTGYLTTFVQDKFAGQYLLNGNVINLVMGVTMQIDNQDYRVIPIRLNGPTNVDLIVTGDDVERATVVSNVAQIVGDLVTSLFHVAFKATENGTHAKSLEGAVQTLLGK